MSSWGDWASTTSSFVWNASGAGNLVQGAKEIYNNSGRGGTWTGMAKGAGKMVMGGTTAYTLPQRGLLSIGLKGANWLLSPTEQTNRENLSPVVKGIGDILGSQRITEQSRQLKYGKLPIDEYFNKHPSEFLKDYAVQSKVQAPDRPGGKSKMNERYQFRTITQATSMFPQMNQITDSSGITRPTKAHLELIKSSDAEQHANVHNSQQVGRDFQAAFLPMLQSKNDQLKSPFKGRKKTDKHTVHDFEQGRINTKSLTQRGITNTITTQLSGCSVTKRKGNLMHIRPKNDGVTLQNSLPYANTFGRNDYPQRGEQAFVMAQTKPSGRTNLHFQTHNSESGTINTGSQRLP